MLIIYIAPSRGTLKERDGDPGDGILSFLATTYSTLDTSPKAQTTEDSVSYLGSLVQCSRYRRGRRHGQKVP